ncbi:MAG TPA: GNAT family N-acetyltransferase [Acidimicrobiia bacterium]|jgi:GNAT superfamily N-acetyltransferase|nr:GNAT family N-acetyltransferase [Acidimicrobiia bacterium]
MNVRPVITSDREWIAEIITTAFGSVQIVSHGEIIEDASLLDGFAVEHDGRPIGCALVNVVGDVAELVALVTTYRGAGAGGALLEAVVDRAKRERWSRLWLITSNDNTDAIRMYQRAGWNWTDFRRDAITRARALKPEIPETGNHGIPVRHEIEFEAPL